MMKALVTALILILGLGSANAQEPEREPEITLEDLRFMLDQLIEVRKITPSTTVKGLTLDLDGVKETFVLRRNAEGLSLQESTQGSATVTILANGGKCKRIPPAWNVIADMGFYLIEFCDPGNNLTNEAEGDFHRRGNGSGGVGKLLETVVVL